MTMTRSDTDMLEVFFQDARAMPPRMPAGLMDRALAGALGAQPEPASQGWRGLLPDLAAQIITGDTFAAADDIRAPELTAFGWDIDGG